MAAKDIKLEHFTGKNTIEAKHWLNLFEVICVEQQLTDNKDKVVKLMSYLKDDALAFFAQKIAPNATTITWADTRALIEKRFGTAEVSSIVHANHRRLHKNETIKEYFDEKMKHLDKTSLTDPEKCDLLTDGVSEAIQSYLIPTIITTTEDWLQRAIRAEMSVNRTSGYSKPSFRKDSQYKPQYKPQFKPHFKPEPQNAYHTDPYQQYPGDCPYLCKICRNLGHEEYHWHRNCPNKTKQFGNRPYGNNSRPSGQRSIQYQQQKPIKGNVSSTQTLRSAHADEENAFSSDSSEDPNQNVDCNNFCTPFNPTISSDTKSRPIPTFPSIEVKLNNKPVKSIVDSGSTISIASENTLKELKLQIKPNSSIILNQISGRTQTLGSFTASLKIQNTIHTTTFHVVPRSPYPLLLGLDVGQQFGLKIDLNSCKFSVSRNPKDNEYRPQHPQQEKTKLNNKSITTPITPDKQPMRTKKNLNRCIPQQSSTLMNVGYAGVPGASSQSTKFNKQSLYPTPSQQNQSNTFRKNFLNQSNTPLRQSQRSFYSRPALSKVNSNWNPSLTPQWPCSSKPNHLRFNRNIFRSFGSPTEPNA